MAKKRFFGLYHKFFIAFMVGGVLPMIVIASVVLNLVFDQYRQALVEGYSQSMEYGVSLMETKLKDYNELSKIAYYYNRNDQSSKFFSYEDPYSLTNILTEPSHEFTEDERLAYLAENKKFRDAEMTKFLRYVSLVDSDILDTFFLDFRGDLYSYCTGSFLKLDVENKDIVPIVDIDKSQKTLLIYPTRRNDYFHGKNDRVITMGRNYFDVSGAPGQSKYIGTLYFDVDLEVINNIFKNMKVYTDGDILIVDENGFCMFSNDESLMGRNVKDQVTTYGQGEFNTLNIKDSLDNGWVMYFRLSYNQVFNQLLQLQRFMYLIIFAMLLALVFSSLMFSKQLIKPIRTLMNKMAMVETGKFDVEIPINSKDELGILSKRFNRMSKELSEYINKVYVSNLKQKEAELTALRSQIYPHFLYNTLEVIRMTAVEHDDIMVSDMIEALSDQIHYIIGKVDDLVTIEDEMYILEKYVFLLNCRIDGLLKLQIDMGGQGKKYIPKLILQPLVENAYVHGLKPKNASGNIHISVLQEEDMLEISVMDNGVGMDKDQAEKLRDLLESDEMGIRNELYWQSIGLKNVNDRIRYLYGQEYGIDFTTSKGTGTMVRIVLPANAKEKDL